MIANWIVTTAAANSESCSTLTLEKLKEVIASMPEDPFEKFMNKHGFSLKAGDKMVLPEWLCSSGGVDEEKLPDGVVVSRYVTDIVMIKNPWLGE